MAIVNAVKMVKIRRKKLYPAFLFPFSIYRLFSVKTKSHLICVGRKQARQLSVVSDLVDKEKLQCICLLLINMCYAYLWQGIT